MMIKIMEIIRSNKLVRVVLTILAIAALIFYFKVFFTKGVIFEDTFLKKEVAVSESHYTGKGAYGRIDISVRKNEDGSTELVYNLPNKIIRQYTVTFKDTADQGSQKVTIINKNGNIIFDGEYRKDSYVLFDKEGQPVTDGLLQVTMNGESPFKGDYSVSLKNIADLACFADDTIRGKLGYLVVAILLFVITVIDIKYPLFFFTFRHFMDVKDPEPSELYLLLQKISWYIYPIIIIVLLIIAIM